MRNILKRNIALILAFAVMIITPLENVIAVQAEDSTKATTQQETKISGLTNNIKTTGSKSIVNNIVVSPSRKATLELQMYVETENNWVTKKRFALTGISNTTDPADSSPSENLTLAYPSSWKKKTYTNWRIHIPASDGYKEYTSETIKITATNIKPLSLTSKSVVIMRADTGEVLYNKSMNKKLPNASTTKMMTALLCLERKKLNSKVKFSSKAAKTDYASLRVKKGEKFYVKDLLHAMLITSSNDSAAALAESISGSQKKFAKLMNKRAKQLGMNRTNFVTPNGLHNKKHYSTAYDLSLLQKQVIKNKTYCSIIAKKSYTFKNVNRKKKFKVYTTDTLLGTCNGFLGGKTGYTSQAGCCFSGAYTYNGVTYIYTVLGSKTSKGRWKDCKTLMKYIRTYN